MRILDTLRQAAPTISVGILTANLMRLTDELHAIDEAGVKVLHFDVMDGCFCPMMTAGPPFIKGIKTTMLKDVHLMIENPLPKLEDYVLSGADMITVHLESEPRHIHRVFQALGKMENSNDQGRGLARGIAINPGTPVAAIESLLGEVDVVTLLAINPGWGGQKFLPSTPERLSQARELINLSGRDVLLCVDGGVTRENIGEIVRMGADLIVTGSAVFDGKSPGENARIMLDALEGANRNV